MCGDPIPRAAAYSTVQYSTVSRCGKPHPVSAPRRGRVCLRASRTRTMMQQIRFLSFQLPSSPKPALDQLQTSSKQAGVYVSVPLLRDDSRRFKAIRDIATPSLILFHPQPTTAHNLSTPPRCFPRSCSLSRPVSPIPPATHSSIHPSVSTPRKVPQLSNPPHPCSKSSHRARHPTRSLAAPPLTPRNQSGGRNGATERSVHRCPATAHPEGPAIWVQRRLGYVLGG